MNTPLSAAVTLLATISTLVTIQAQQIDDPIKKGNDAYIASLNLGDGIGPAPNYLAPNSLASDSNERLASDSDELLASDELTTDIGCCSQGCGRACCCCGKPRLLGLIAPSDPCFSGFVSPMTNPVYFEDPRTLTEARFFFLRHKVPQPAGGGNIRVIAMQMRAALTKRLSLIATKDGFMMSNNALINDGWGDVAAGLKYVLFSDPRSQRILSAGMTYELPVGSTRSLQGNGDGLFTVFMTGGAQFYAWHVMSATGFLLPSDTAAESQIWYWSAHVDRRLGCSNLYWVSEFNWYHYLRSGRGGIPGVEGGDLFNFGSTGVAGNDIVTGALGIKFKPSSGMELGVAWEAPLTSRRDVLDNRLTVDCIFRY